MVDIKPFRGYYYNRNKVADIFKAIAPPYDVISQEKREGYLSYPYNIVHLTLPQGAPNEDRYSYAYTLLQEWIRDEVLVQDEGPSLYLLEHLFNLHGKTIVRKGFFALVKLEDLAKGNIHPHEATLSAPKKDRFELLKATRAHLSPIFSLYVDEREEIIGALQSKKEDSPLFNIAFEDHQELTLWKASERNVREKVKEIMAHKRLYIADGHHRYETALNFSRMSNEPSHKWVMMYLCPMDGKVLKILPAHRLLKHFSSENLRERKEKGKEHFRVNTVPFTTIEDLLVSLKEEKDRRHVFGVYVKGEDPLVLVSKKEKEWVDEMGNHSPAWKNLDISILHSLIFSHILGWEEEELQREGNLTYVVDRDETIRLVEEEECKVAFLLNSTRLREVRMVAERGEKMPGKATYFYPKVPSGLVMNLIE